MNLIPNVPPLLFTLSATAIGYALLDDSTANEQNALGNWFMLVGQVLCTNASHQYVKNERNNPNAHNPNNNSPPKQDTKEDTIRMMNKIKEALNNEINNIKNNPQ